MRPERSLKRRIAQSFALLAFILSLFFCLVSYTAVEVIESEVMDDRLEKIIEVLIAHNSRQEQYVPPPGISIFIGDGIPQELRSVQPGIQELLLHGRESQALVRDHNGGRYAVVQDMTQFEHLEFVIFSSLGIGFITSLLLALIVGLATARSIVAPLTALADAVAASTRPSALPGVDADDEIGILARAFAHRTEELQQFLSRERLFTSDVSHELRTPLTIMLGAAELLKLRLNNSPGQQEIAERIRRVAAETTERVSALLLLSRAPEKLAGTVVSVNSLVRIELERYSPLLVGKSVEWRFEEADGVWAQGRPELIGIAVGNLVRNAFQHTECGDVTVRLRHGCIVIEDTGPGLPESIAQRLFERFVHGRETSTEGTGLGLSIVKRVTEHLGWDIRFEQPEQGGSRFVLEFPPVAPGH
ncbi:HAMP domain-containing sensor histidine kinase [Noviherbaspirillum sp. CPCC 100848]|uniref:histidine kinase n=1 Tax=Noviherbaspirillum album TaxID=3080276 RepID=A0ABU6J4H5_9BURK|nr:HAMP domain-containing sensor histidine kinase [Noviherbaspirillum sp. CPCC 100848]MEC4718425.1 HAMP domain-containing sensor histidine kinase [Noviherbaspirillum sp. CPCC 100848]